jgi:VWFA-related protein
VAIDVSVRIRNNPVPGLTEADFELLDNKIPQHVQTLSIEAMPLDVTIVLDASASMADWAGRLQQNTAQILARLNPDDRLRVLCFGSEVRELLPWHTPPQRARLRGALPYLGPTALNDALALALVHVTEPDRRHLLVAFTDAVDNASVLTADQLLAVARVSDASVHLVQHLPPHGNALPPTWSGGSVATLENMVAVTGGRWYSTLTGSAPGMFEQVLADYRSRYLLRYTPEGVAPGGWHDVQIRVPRLRNATIHARKGYDGTDPLLRR